MDNISTSKHAADLSKIQDGQLVNIPITDENTALNVLVAFCGVANKRGAFNLQESAKIWESIQRFSQPLPQPSSPVYYSQPMSPLSAQL
jgi:hypothetical protein